MLLHKLTATSGTFLFSPPQEYKGHGSLIQNHHNEGKLQARHCSGHNFFLKKYVKDKDSIHDTGKMVLNISHWLQRASLSLLKD